MESMPKDFHKENNNYYQYGTTQIDCMSLPSDNVDGLQEDSNTSLMIDGERNLICKRKLQWNDRNRKDLNPV